MLKTATPPPFESRVSTPSYTGSTPLTQLCFQPRTWRHQAISKNATQGSYFISCHSIFLLNVINRSITQKNLRSHSLLSVQWTSGHNVSLLLYSAVTAGKVMLIVPHHSNAQWDYIKGNHNKRDNLLPPNPLQSDWTLHI